MSKEQDAAHSEIEKKAEIYANRVLDTRKRSGAFNGYIAGYRALNEELTRLRSELQQKDEQIDFLKTQIIDLRSRNKDSAPF